MCQMDMMIVYRISDCCLENIILSLLIKLQSNVLFNIFISVIIIGSEDVNTALLLSIFLGRNDYIYKLTSNFYADVNASDNKGRTALHWTCTFNNPYATKILLNYGAEINQWDNAKKFTPLHCAASVGSIQCIELLIKRGVQINAGIEKRSALHLAIEKSFVNCVEILLKNGANPNTPQVK